MPGPLARSAAHITHSFTHCSPSHHQVGKSLALPARLSSTRNETQLKMFPRRDTAAPSWSEGPGVFMYDLMARAHVLICRRTGAARLLSFVISSFLRNQLLGVLPEPMFYSWSHRPTWLPLGVAGNWRAKRLLSQWREW